MSSTHLREHINKVISKLSILFFAILTFTINANLAHATTLGSCGEIAVSGTYTLSSDLGTVGANCITVTTSGVTIDGLSTYSVLGNISGNRTNYTLTNVVSTGDLSIFYYNNAAADGNWANKANWWLDSAYTLTANRSGITVPSTQDTVVVNGNVSQISTGVASVFSARFINNATWNVGSSITDGLVWTKSDNTIPSVSDTSSTNGRLPLGNSGRGDMTQVYPVSVMKDGSTYKMWYQGADNSYNRIFYATSANGLTWTKYDNTVPSASDTTSTNGRIPVGTSGKGDANGVGSAQVIKEGSTYKMWYSGLAADGIWRVYYATSPDGLTWTKYDNTVPSASDTTSTNGRIPVGTSGKGDTTYVLLKQIIRDGDLYKMWYRGYDGTSVRTYLATSPDGLTWTKYDNTVPSASDTTSTNGRIPVGTSGKGDDLHAQIPVIYKDGAMYKMFYSGYTSVGSFYSGFYATSPDGLTWTKYNNTIPSTSDTTSTDGRIPKGNAGRLDSTGVLLTSGLLDNNVFKIWYSGYSGTNWRGAYATASNSYRALNLFVNSEGSVLFEGNSKFGKGTISTSNSIAVDEVSFSGTSIATEAVILSDVVNINTSTSTTGIFEIQNSGAVVNVDNVSESSTINIVSSSSTLNLNNSVNLNSVTGSGLELNLNDSSSVDSFNLVGNSTIKFNTDYYDGSSASTDGVLVINNRTFAGVIQSATTLLDSDDNEITEFEFRGTASNTSRGIDVPVSFYDSSTNSGTISADVTVNAPVTRPIGGTITGTVLYLGYDGFYYNNAAADGNWLNLSNWWSDSAHTTPATLPTQIDDVFVSGNISSFPNTGNALNTVSVAGTNGAWSLGTFSVSMWYNSKNSNWVQYMYSSGGVLYIQVRGQGSNPPYFRVYMGGSHTDFFAPSGIPNVVDKWTHVVFVRASDGKGYMYFNGQASPQNGANVGTTTLVPIAVLPRDSITDEFIVYDKALSQAEVNALYNNGAPVKITDLTNVYAYYSMDQSSGTTVTDNSGNGRNITFSSGYPSWQSGIVRKEDSTFPEVQSLNMSSGTNSTTIQTTLGATFSNTAAHNGTVFGSATFLEDDPTMSASAIASTDTTIKNRSLNFNGVNAFGTASNPGITGNTLTMSTWVKVDNYTGAAWKHIFGSNLAVPTSCPASPYTPYMFAAYSGSPGGVNFGVSTGADRTFVSVANTYIPLNQWTHLTGTYDGTTMKFYVNGVLRGSTPKTGNITAAPSGGLTFGSYPCASNRDWFTGGLSDTAIWNVALTQDQVTSLYNSAPDRIGVTPLSFWKFDAGSGSTAADSVGGRTVTLTSTQWQSSVPPIKYTDNATLTRIYTADATTTKDFTLNSGRWFIESDGADIDLSGATYAVSTTTYQSNKNVFRAKNGATFTENPSINGGAHVVPKVAVNSPVAGTNIRWNPDVDWDDADTCQYKWGANGTYANVSCAAGGSDIPRPTAFATTTLYVKGIYNDTSYSEQLSPSFVYDNVAPISTDCTFDMDESTRQYYYLESDVTGDCTATANITLKGASTTDATYTLNGQMIANATSTTAGFNLNLQNIIITGTTTANGGGNGNRGGSITVTDSTLANIVTNGGNISLTNVTTGSIDADGNTGLSTAATISITNSTTTDITANGGTGGSGVGGNGAAITITNSSVGLVDTNGGSSGKRGGAVTITDSTTSNITTNGGAISITNSVTSQLASNSNSGGILGGNITVDVSTTTAIYANGGNITISTSSVGLLDSTSPTAGIAGGDITVTNPVSEIPSITTNGGDVTLNNVVVVGSITANGNTGGVSAGAISISNSTTTAIYANGGTHASGNGGNGATITIATSTTGLIEASGADSTGDGGDGGIITITNSIGTSATSTPITANGGDSTSCGDGGDSGIVTIVDTTYGTITAEPGVGFNGGCPSDTKSSGIRNTVTTVGEGHSSIPRPSAPVTPSNPGAIGGGINPLFRNGLNGLDFTPIQQFNLFGDGSGGGFKPIDAGTTRLPKVFTDLNRLNDFLLDEMPVDILPSLELFVFDEVSGELADLFPNASNLLAAAGVERTQQLASLFRSPKLISDIENPEKYGLFKVYSGDVLVNTYVAYEQAVENLAQLIKANPSQIIHIGTYVKGKITDDSKIPYIVYQGQKKLMTPTFDGYYATSIIVPNLEGRYLIETSSSVQILLDVLPQNNTNEQSKPWGIFNRLWKLFH